MFTVKIDGKIDSIEFIKHDDSINDVEAVRLLSLTDGAWRPGRIDGQRISERMIIRYYFFDNSKESSADKNISKAKKSYNKNSFEQCVNFCDQALEVNPFATEVLKLKGISLLKLGLKNESCETLNLAKHYYAENIDELISESCPGTSTNGSGRMYFDEFGFPTQQANSKSYRIVTNHPAEPGKFLMKEYSITDSIKEVGTFSDTEIFTKDGLFTVFYSNGQKSEEGFYKNNSKTGKWTKWYMNGQVREESFWDDLKDFEKRERIENFWDSLGNKLVSNGKGEYNSDEESPVIYAKGLINSGLKNGKFTGFFRDGSIAFEEEYNDNKLTKGISFDPSGRKYKYDKVIEPNMMPLYEFISKNLRYPPEARSNGVQGKVTIHILFDSDGKIVKSRIVKGIGSGCDEEVLRVISQYSGTWDNGKMRGQSTKINKPHFKFLPIHFKLG